MWRVDILRIWYSPTKMSKAIHKSSLLKSLSTETEEDGGKIVEITKRKNISFEANRCVRWALNSTNFQNEFDQNDFDVLFSAFMMTRISSVRFWLLLAADTADKITADTKIHSKCSDWERIIRNKCLFRRFWHIAFDCCRNSIWDKRMRQTSSQYTIHSHTHTTHTPAFIHYRMRRWQTNNIYSLHIIILNVFRGTFSFIRFCTRVMYLLHSNKR